MHLVARHTALRFCGDQSCPLGMLITNTLSSGMNSPILFRLGYSDAGKMSPFGFTSVLMSVACRCFFAMMI